MNDLSRSSVLAIDVVSSVGNKYNPMVWEKVRFISDEKNCPVRPNSGVNWLFSDLLEPESLLCSHLVQELNGLQILYKLRRVFSVRDGDE